MTHIVDGQLKAYLVADGGLHHPLAASGNFSQVVQKNHPVTIVNKADAEDREVASVVGSMCTSLDLLADRLSLRMAQVGDLAVVFQPRAYGISASPQGFLGNPACVFAALAPRA